MVLEIWMAEE